MAKYVLKDADLTVDGSSVSSRVRQIEVSMTADDIDSTTMGEGVHQHLGGLRQDQFVATFANDPLILDPILYPLLSTADATPEFPVIAKATSAAASASNPSYSTLLAILLNYAPISGEIGALSEIQVTFPSNEQIVRAYT